MGSRIVDEETIRRWIAENGGSSPSSSYLVYASVGSFPITGETLKIYEAFDTGVTYKWTGAAYVNIVPLIYSVRLAQEDTNAPVVVATLRNDLGTDVVWTYISAGHYRGTLLNAFPSGKVVPFCSTNPLDGGNGLQCTENDDYITPNSEIVLNTFDTGNFANNKLNGGINSIINMIVYP